MLSKSAEYAIRALVYIASENEGGSRPGYREIARKTNAPEHFMAKILQSLIHQSLLHAGRGRGGGFYLQDSGRDINLYQVIVAIEGEKKMHGCGLGLANCSTDHPCPFHDKYAPIRDMYMNLAISTSIFSLSESIRSGAGVLVWPPVS